MNDQIAKASQVSILSDIFMTPAKGMNSLKTNTTIMLPLAVFLLFNVAFLFYCFSKVDFSWMVEQTVQAAAGDKSKSDMEQMRQGFEMFGKNGMMWSGIVGVLIMIPVIFAVQSGYYSLVSNIRGDGVKFKQWFSFTCWTALPGLISVVASFVMVFLSDNGQISQQGANPLSLNSLFFNYPPEQGIGALLTSLHLGAFWSWFVSIIGYSAWTNTSKGTASAIVIGPWVVIFGIWALFFI